MDAVPSTDPENNLPSAVNASMDRDLSVDSVATSVFQVDMLPGVCAFCVRNVHFPRWLAVIVTILVGLGLMVLVGYITALSVLKLQDNWDTVYIPGAKAFGKTLSALNSILGDTLRLRAFAVLERLTVFHPSKIAAWLAKLASKVGLSLNNDIEPYLVNLLEVII